MNKLQAMADGGHKLALVRQQLVDALRPGITLLEIDRLAEKLLLQTGGEPAFKKVRNYQWSTCINVNQGVVHGIPNQYRIQSGDLVSIDVGLYYQNYYTDTSTTVPVGVVPSELIHFLKIGKKSLKKAISEAKPGNRVGHITKAMQKTIESAGYSVVYNLTGHGIGTELHENPRIPCSLDKPIAKTPHLKIDQTIAIEAIYTLGKPNLVTEPDGWTISTQDGKMAGLFEETIAITANGPVILTQ